jgi:CPA2 family monovalent cation:H+ antiporter-2
LAITFKIGGSDRWLFSLGLAQAGEFGFVLLSFTVANGVIPGDFADRLLLIVALSMLLTPALFILYDRVIAPRFTGLDDREMDHIAEKSEIIIAGHGRVGGIVSRILRGSGMTPTVMDFSSKQLEMLKAFNVQAYYGDATRPDLLSAAGIANAKLFVIAIDDKDQITGLVKYVHHNYPDVHIVARAVDRGHVYDLWHAGCRDIIRDTYDSSLRMGRSAIEALGYSKDQAGRIVDAFSALDRKAMLVAADHHDPAIPMHQNEALLAQFHERNVEWQAELTAQTETIMAEKSL